MTLTDLGRPYGADYAPGTQPGASQMAVITSEQIKAARALLRWEQKDLSEASGLSLGTIKVIEQRPGLLIVRTTSLYALLDAFNKVGIEFLEPNNGGEGVRFKRGNR